MTDWRTRLRDTRHEVRAELKRIYEAVLRGRQEDKKHGPERA